VDTRTQFVPLYLSIRLHLQGPDEHAKKRVHPAAIAHANRVARAQQAGVTLYGYKVFPDLTPGRAFMWGSILAVWAVGSVALASARALDIHSVRNLTCTAK
jgi:hypothetical protein